MITDRSIASPGLTGDCGVGIERRIRIRIRIRIMERDLTLGFLQHQRVSTGIRIGQRRERKVVLK